MTPRHAFGRSCHPTTRPETAKVERLDHPITRKESRKPCRGPESGQTHLELANASTEPARSLHLVRGIPSLFDWVSSATQQTVTADPAGADRPIRRAALPQEVDAARCSLRRFTDGLQQMVPLPVGRCTDAPPLRCHDARFPAAHVGQEQERQCRKLDTGAVVRHAGTGQQNDSDRLRALTIALDQAVLHALDKPRARTREPDGPSSFRQVRAQVS